MNCFVILHYKNMKDTLECIESIRKINGGKQSKIIIVDNHTLNHTDEEKLKTIVDDIILLDDNLGFARANNRGIQYAQEKYHPDFVIVINNDTLIYQKDFLNRIQQDEEIYHFDMLGPWIDTSEGDSVNPFPVYQNKQEVEHAIKEVKILLKIYHSKILRTLFHVYQKVKHHNKPVEHLKNGETVQTGVALHGCAIIFSKKYLDRYSEAFDSSTFLYHEEEFLYCLMKKDHLTSLYDPNLKIFHKEGASLNECFTNQEYQKKIFHAEERLKSLELLYTKYYIEKEK